MVDQNNTPPNDDVELVKEYQKTRSGKVLSQLIRNNFDAITYRASQFRSAPVPYEAILGEGMRLVATAAERYDTKSDIKFRTFLSQWLLGVHRYVQQNKRVDRVPEHRLLQVHRYRVQKSLMQTQLDREPDTTEMADALNWSVSDVEEMERVMGRKSYAASGLEGVEGSDNFEAKYWEKVDLVYASWNDTEKAVFDYSVGAHGKPVIKSVVGIASKLNLSADAVYRLKKKLAQDLR